VQLIVLVGLGVIFGLSPVLGVERLLALLMLAGSGRWADVGPRGVGFPLLLSAAMLFAWLTQRREFRPALAHKNSLGYLMIPFLGWLGLSLLWSPTPDSQIYGFEKLSRLVLVDALAVVVLGSVARNPDSRRRVISLIGLGSLAVTAFSVAAAGPSLLFGDGKQVAERLSLFGTDPINLGFLAGIGFIASVDPVLAASYGWMRRTRIVALPICAVALIACGSKSILLGFAVTLVLLLMRRRRGDTSNRWRKYLLLAIVAMPLLPFVLPSEYVLRLQPDVFLPDQAGLAQSGSVTIRQALWDDAISRIRSSPLAGQGLGSFNTTEVQAFGTRIGDANGVAYPHNFMLEVAAEAGEVGLLLLAVAVVPIARVIVGRRGVLEPTVIAMIVLGVVRALFTGDLSDHRVLLFGVALALTWRTASESAASEELVGFGHVR
jgi:O-antigen ligase